MKKLWLLSLGILTLSFLSACGFHLRGQGFDLNKTNVLLQTSSPYADFERSLKERLSIQGGHWVEDIADSKLQLGIEQYQVEERVIARDANGRPSELELIFSLNYRLGVTGQEYENGLAPLQVLTSRREYAFDRNLETGQDIEKQRLILDMQQDVVSRLLLQMAKTK